MQTYRQFSVISVNYTAVKLVLLFIYSLIFGHYWHCYNDVTV